MKGSKPLASTKTKKNESVHSTPKKKVETIAPIEMDLKTLDSLIESSLDDFEEQEMNDKVAQLSSVAEGADVKVSVEELEAQRIMEIEKMQNMLNQLNDPNFGHSLQDTLKSLSMTNESNQSVDHLFATLGKQFDQDFKSGVVPVAPGDTNGIKGADRQVAATLQMLGGAQQGMLGFEANKLEEAGETMMEDMIAQFEALGEKEDYNEVIDNVMRQLLSRDLMYDPIKQVCAKFPEWLALHRPHLAEKSYSDYGKMYMVFQKILAVYDTEPDNFPRLMELMYDIQQYGQPPGEIIKGLAPGLKFDVHGMPIMPNMGSGMMPEMPGGEGMPNMGIPLNNMMGGQCSVM